MRILILIAAGFGASGAWTPQIDLYPHVVMAGSGVRLTCRVPRHADNRVLAFGFTNWQYSERQLDGLDARVTWDAVYDHVPCDPGEGFCEVWRVGGSVQQVQVPLIVGGCSP